MQLHAHRSAFNLLPYTLNYLSLCTMANRLKADKAGKEKASKSGKVQA